MHIEAPCNVIVLRVRVMADSDALMAADDVSSDAEGLGIVSAMVRLGVIRQCNKPAEAAASSSSEGVGISVDGGCVFVGAGRPGPV